MADLRLNSGEQNRVPDDVDVRAVEATGGRVLHRFHGAVVRAALDTGAVRAHVAGPRAIAEYASVVDDTTTDLRVPTQVYYRRPPTGADLRALARRGGESIGQANARKAVVETLTL